MDSSSYLTTSRSHSPASTRPFSSSTSLTPPFQFPFDGSSYRPYHLPEVTLQGGMVDVSLLSHGLKLGTCRSDSTTERPLFSPLSSLLRTSVITGDGSETKSDIPHSKLRPSRTLVHAARSPSPGALPLSGTLAVMKAEAFSALHRTCSRAKRGVDSAANVALEALEARGIGMGVSTGS
jgi:hypothetical protein